ncbi:MAG: sel1 repeat family protein [Synergistaceae bacterium]|nr:sel1 repeat family protein [Synergistaceae bacterium]
MQAAEKGHMNAQFHLAEYYAHKNNHSEALKWFDKAAQQNHVRALRIAGNMYKRGIGTEINSQKAFEYYIKADELGKDSWAQTAIGHMYQTGQYVKKDLKKALQRLRVK